MIGCEAICRTATRNVRSPAPVVGAVIQNRDTSVKVNTIQMTVNGSVVPATVAANADGASLNWAMSPLPASGAVNTAKVTFKDNLNVDVSTEWTFVINYVSLDPANRQAGTGKTRGFKVRMVQSPEGTELANDLQRAEDLVALSPSLPTPLVDTNTVLQLVNMAQDDRSSGYFTGPDYPEDLVPGLDQNPGLTDGFTVEINAYLDLTAGAHRFGVVTDDGYKISAGASLSDKNPILGAKSGGTANETFDFVVPVAGLYPFRMIWYEQGGNAYAEWFSVDLATGVRTLINDAKTATAVKAYLDLSAPSIKVQSSTTANGTFADDPGAQVDTNAKTATAPISGGQRFFRISGASRITSTVVNGTNLVMTYE